jgi:hypothetical protein
MRNITKRSIAITAAVAALAGAGVAFAAWTTNGSGSGSVTAASSKQLVITQSGTATGLYPTGSVPVSFTVKNDNPYAVALTGATGGTFTVDAAHSGCNVASLSATPVSLTGTTVAANSTSPAQQITVKMDNTAVDACQGATIGFTISVSGASA